MDLKIFSSFFQEPDPYIESIRGNMINRTHGWKKVAVKVHIDEMVSMID